MFNCVYIILFLAFRLFSCEEVVRKAICEFSNNTGSYIKERWCSFMRIVSNNRYINLRSFYSKFRHRYHLNAFWGVVTRCDRIQRLSVNGGAAHARLFWNGSLFQWSEA